jgi:hypothetical protein
VQTLTFTCPQTGRVIDTGVNTDPLTLASVQKVTMSLKCLYCGMQHQFPIERGLLSQPLYWPSRRLAKSVCVPEKRRRRHASFASQLHIPLSSMSRTAGFLPVVTWGYALMASPFSFIQR